MTHVVRSSRRLSYETAFQQYSCGRGETGTPRIRTEGMSTVEVGAATLQNQPDAPVLFESPQSPRRAGVTKSGYLDDSEHFVPTGKATLSPLPHWQCENDTEDTVMPVCTPLGNASDSQASFRKTLNNKYDPVDVHRTWNRIPQCEQEANPSLPNILHEQQKAVLRSNLEMNRRSMPSQCSLHAACASENLCAAKGRLEPTTEAKVQRGELKEGAIDRLSEVENILEQLIQEAKVLRIENMKLRAARDDLQNTSEAPREAEGAGGKNFSVCSKLEADKLRSRLREANERLRCLRRESAPTSACSEERDNKALRELLSCKEDALRKSELEISALRSELELLKTGDELKKTELEELRFRYEELLCQQLRRQQELRSCASEAISLRAEAAAAKHAQLNKAWELKQMDRRLLDQVDEQVKGRASEDAGKHQAEDEISRLRAALRSVSERSLCQAEQLHDRDEEVSILQQRVDRLLMQRERDATRMMEQGEAMLRWRTYILFLEKLIRDLRGYIVSQAAASDGSNYTAPTSSSPAFAVFRQHERGGDPGPLKLQQDTRELRKAVLERHAVRRREVKAEMPKSLAAVGYNLLPFPSSSYEPSSCQSFAGGLPSMCKMSLQQLASPSQRLTVGFTQQNEESVSVENLGRLLQEAAEELRATAAAARRGQTSRSLESWDACCSRPVLCGALSPGSTEASSIGAIGDTSECTPVDLNDPASREPANRCQKSLRRHSLNLPNACPAFTERPLVSERQNFGHGCGVPGSLTDGGSLSDVSSLLRAPGRRRVSCTQLLRKGEAAAHLAKEIATRFPRAFDRLQKSNLTCRLLNRK